MIDTSLSPSAPAAPNPPVLLRPRLQRGSIARELLETVVLIVVVYTLFNLATVRFYIEGPSMQPNFWAGQYLVVSRLHYLFGEPQRGDVVVFDPPGDDDNPRDNPLLIKRLIGLPGETVELREGALFIDGRAYSEPYTNEPCQTRCDGSWSLGANEYFFMGDNRNNSRDSRVFGVVSRDRIMGEVVLRYFPPPDFSFIPGYSYPESVESAS
ncbi:MAG: signal peptidase I [bacterium]|nr:signal peptidase I [bacterium]